MPIADVTAPDQYRGHLLDAIEPKGPAAQVKVLVIVPIPAMIEGRDVSNNIMDIILLGLERPPLSGPTSTSQSTDDDEGLRGTGWGEGGPVYLET